MCRHLDVRMNVWHRNTISTKFIAWTLCKQHANCEKLIFRRNNCQRVQFDRQIFALNRQLLRRAILFRVFSPIDLFTCFDFTYTSIHNICEIYMKIISHKMPWIALLFTQPMKTIRICNCWKTFYSDSIRLVEILFKQSTEKSIAIRKTEKKRMRMGMEKWITSFVVTCSFTWKICSITYGI